MELTTSVKAANIIVRCMNDFRDRDISQNVSEGIEVMESYRIDDVDFVTGGNLNKAELFGVMVAAVGFSIKGDGT
jgi:hypothetical protein